MKFLQACLAVVAVFLFMGVEVQVQAHVKLKVNFTGMNPHVGQKFELRVVSKRTRMEVGRTGLASIPGADFDVQLEESIEAGESYWIDFYADLNQNGLYDAPPTDHAWRLNLDEVQGDTTLTFAHNTNFTDIDWVYLLSVSLTNMNPHLNQKFELRVVDVASGQEIGRFRRFSLATPDFMAEIPGLRIGHTYSVDFYADLNQNGQYDAPPTDHAWRLMAENVQGDTQLDFVHNTNFTDIGWVYEAILQLSNMNPHLGQKFEARVIDLFNMKEVGRASLDAVVVPDFQVSIPGVVPGHSYWIDFYADLNQNGLYDSPPTDHTWREQFDASGDATVQFTHNTNFTDTGWDYLFTLNLKNMNPHVGQKFEARVIDLSTMKEVGRASLNAILVPDFQVMIPGLQPGGTYWVDFYADLNQNGLYDSPPSDHTWREEFTSEGDTQVDFTHNTNFTDTGWEYLFTLHLNNMNPHVGQKFEARVIRDEDGAEVGRTNLASILVPNFAVSIPGIMPGTNYHVDYYADLNQNGIYDTPPNDHAWRDSFTAQGDASVDFTHNTNFTDIDWVYMFTLHLKNMNPHLGQLFELRVVDLADNSEVGRTRRASILLPDFAVSVPGIRIGKDYNVDFYADFNQNGKYDSPPTDHAWRQMFSNSTGDVDMDFTHNTNFTDVQFPGPTGVEVRDEIAGLPREFALAQNYPNPFNPETNIRFDVPKASRVKLVIYNSLGQKVRVLVDQKMSPGRYSATWDGRTETGRPLGSGLYLYRLEAEGFASVQRMVLLK